MSEKAAPAPRWDLEAIRDRVAMPELCTGRLGMELRAAGRAFVGRCPVHGEKTPSFKVEMGKHGWWCKCFGCDLKGDIFALWMAVHGGTFAEACAVLSGFAGLGPLPAGWSPLKPKKRHLPPPPQVRDAAFELPPLRPLSAATCAELAALRGLSPAGVQAAAAAGMVKGQVFGLSSRPVGHRGLVWGDEMRREGEAGYLRVNPVRCWVVTDGSGALAQVRRLDGKAWPRRDGGEFKAWTIGTATWPLGALEIGARAGVLLVEGGPDLLAAWDFIVGSQRSEVGSRKSDVGCLTSDIRPVAVLGASVNLRQDALLSFMGKRVLILPHTDKVNEKNGRQAGFHAAGRWASQLRESWGVPVEEYRLPLPEGTTGDLNDAARDAVLAAAVRERILQFSETLTSAAL